MAIWRCPHCGTPQPETARCWVCRRSTTVCATCRHFRRAVALSVGYCGLDRHRSPLSGSEQRGCWERAAERRPATGTEPLPAEAARSGLWIKDDEPGPAE